MKYGPRTANFQGKVQPIVNGETWVEGEMMCSAYGQFRRRGLVRHKISKVLVKVRCDISDTTFSIPATTDKEHGFVSINPDTGEFEFTPHKDQSVTPSRFRRSSWR